MRIEQRNSPRACWRVRGRRELLLSWSRGKSTQLLFLSPFAFSFIVVNSKNSILKLFLKSACDTAHCENGGTCQSGFTDKGYRCLCPPGFMFVHCKQGK